MESAQRTLAAAEITSYDRPVLIAWGTRDRLLRVRDAQRLADTLPNARLELIENARTYVQTINTRNWQTC